MKMIVTGDIHLKMWSDKQIDGKGIPQRVNEIFQVLDSICQYATENNIEYIIVAGDLNDTKSIVHVRPFVILKNLISQYPNIQFIFINGNHDISGRADFESAIELMNGPENVRTVTETEIDFDGKVAYVPFSTHIINDIAELDDSVEVLISHFGLNDATLSSGISLKTGIGANDLSHFKQVFLGHYHKPQEIKNVAYVGSPIPLRRDEKNEKKRFIVFDLETMKFESVPTTGYRIYYEFIIGEEYKDDKTKLESLLNEIQELRSQGHYVVVRNLLREIPDEVKKQDITIIDDFEEEYEMRGITMSMSLREQMDKYMEIMRIEDSQKNDYLNFGTRVIEST